MADLERGKRIKALRKAKGERDGHKITQPQMAEAVGVTLRAAQEWEYGGGIDDENLPALLEFLETDADYLLRGRRTNDDTPDLLGTLDDVDQAQIDRIERKLDELLKRTSPPQAPPGTGPPGEEPPGPHPPDEPIPPTHPPDEADTGEAETG